MIHVLLPSGVSTQFPHPVRLSDVADRFFVRTQRYPAAALLDGTVAGLQSFLPDTESVKLSFLFSDSIPALEILRHSTAHLMARAVCRLFPNVQLAFGPAVDNGFYYDFALEHTLTEEDFPRIEAEMRRLIAQGDEFECLEVSHEQAAALLEEMKQPLKLQHLNTNLKDKKSVFFYRQGAFLDLSRGPHVLNVKILGNFKLLSVAETHWKGDPQSPVLQRLYGTAFFEREQLERHLEMLEMAKKRDHRLLGRQLELFSIDQRVGSGLVLWQPKGAVLRHQLESFLFDKLTQNQFQQVYSPEIGRVGLYRITGKNPLSAESPYPIFEAERNDRYVLRPTCGPQHVTIYQNHPRSYRELPLRFFEFGNVCKYEPSGELFGLKCVRAFTRNDAHVFCAQEDAATEFRRCLMLLENNLKAFGFRNLRIQTCFRSKNDVRYFGLPEQWQRAEQMILDECRKLGYSPFPGGVVHPEGPGIDFVAEDSLERDWHFGTIHIDYNLPSEESFDLSYVGSDNLLHRPIMLHCTPLDSFERFIGVLIEHFAGAFPLWMAPDQVIVINVSPKYEAFAREIEIQLKQYGIRTTGDYRSEKVGAKIRRAQLQLVPYMLILGEREMTNGTVAVRDRIAGNLGNFTVAEAAALFLKEIQEKTLKYAPGTV